ncbi:hypothetical protein Tco_0471855 [Tanacetum coccineum]
MAEYSQKWHNGTSRVRSTKTSDGLAAIQAQLNNLGREIKKVNEKVYATQVGCEQCKGPYYTKDCPLKEEGKPLEEAYYTQFGRPFQGGGYRATTPATTYANIRNQGASIKTLEIQIRQMSKNSKLLYKSRQTTLTFLSRLDNHYCEEEEGNYGPKFMEAYGASHINDTIHRKEKDPRSFTLPCFINNTCFDNALVDLGASISVMPLLTYLNLGSGELAHTRLTVELADRTVKYPKGIAENVLVVLEDMDVYRDEGMGDVIVGKLFLREVGIKAKRFKRIINLYKSDDEVREKDEKNGISHAYQKLKGFYKGALNLGPDYIRNAKAEEWLTRGHISVHEMK